MSQDALICQSCGMPMEKPEDFGTNLDATQNNDYCTYCYQKGAFTWKGTMEEMIEKLIPFSTQMGVSIEKARKMGKEKLPLLKRWKSKES
ncbi:MAG: zinc ribbon domain-containing protein [Candidatus Roizmanbacteria bacterium]